MLREHKIGIFCLMLINMQDGFDLLSIAFAASSISKQWGLSQSSLGLVFSASLMGMLIGATFMSPYADRIGRKPMIIMGLLLSGIGMICAGMSVDVKWLFAGRLITGIGVGAIIASINTLAAEYATDKNRSTMIALLQLGFPIGAFASGYLCLWILDIATWRYIFFLGAALSFIFIPVVFILPASNEYSRIENYKQGRPGLFKLQEVLTVKYKYRTFLICLSFLLLLMTLYFLLSWVPKLFVDLGYSDSEGNRAGRLINLIGMIGIIAIGFLALKFNMAKLSAIFLVALAVLMTFISIYSPSVFILTLLVATLGFFTHGAMIGLYSTVPTLFPPQLRATGTGVAIGVSRIGAVAGPALAGYLLQWGVEPQKLFLIFGLPALIGALCIYKLRQHIQ